MSKLYRDTVIQVAILEIGYMEKKSNAYLDDKTANAGNGNYTKYARDLWEAVPHFYQGSKQGYEWCATWYDWCLYVACGRDSSYAQAAKFYTGPYGAGCHYAAGYYKAAGAWYKDPMPGDQIFFGAPDSIQHTGLVEKVENGRVYTIEGNSNNMVRRCTYSLTDSSIVGYGRPRYDGDHEPVDPGDGVTKAEVEQMINEALALQSQELSSAWAKSLNEAMTSVNNALNAMTNNIGECMTQLSAVKVDVDGLKKNEPKRYYLLKDVTEPWYRPTMDMLVEQKFIVGKGGSGEDTIIDMIEDTIRVFVALNNAGLFKLLTVLRSINLAEADVATVKGVLVAEAQK